MRQWAEAGINDTELTTALERQGYTSKESTPEALWEAVYRGRTGIESMSIDRMYDEGRLYQDANGTMPVTGVEQPVGLMLDGSQRQRLGPELVTNGDFSDGLTGWSTAGTVESGRVTVEATGIAIGLCKQGIHSSGAPVGSLYWLQYDVVDNTLQPGTGAMMAVHNDSDFKLLSGTWLPSAVGTHRALVKRVADTTGGLYVFLSAQQASGTISVDNISLRENLGNHPNQPTDINRPIVSARVNGLRNTENIVSANWTAHNALQVDGETLRESTATNAYHDLYHSGSGFVVPDGTYTLRVKVKRGAGNRNIAFRGFSTSVSESDHPYFELSGEGRVVSEGENWFDASIERDGEGWYVCRASTTAVTATGPYINMTTESHVRQYDGDGTSTIQVKEIDLRYTNDGVDLPEYQRVGNVGTTPDDYDSLNFPMYLAFNGTNQSLKVTGMQPEVDEVFVSAAARTEESSTARIIAELSTNANANDGSFRLTSGASGVHKYYFRSAGTAPAGSITDQYPAPVSHVITGLADISENLCLLRINGIRKSKSTTDQGMGNYGNYNLYIGSRAGTSMFYEGRLYGILLVFDNPADTIITTIERELNRKAKIHA